MSFLSELKESLLHLAFPHVCEGCGSDGLAKEQWLCLRCLSQLPHTGFEQAGGNPVEKIFWGRLPLQAAAAHYYFTKASIVQHLLHALKYKGQADLGRYLGRQIGRSLTTAERFADVDALVPLPLFRPREQKRGYNQAALLCEGIAEAWTKPVLTDAVQRVRSTETQTRKSRLERWANMEGRFVAGNTAALTGRHVLLVDDVITTGATLEACGRALLAIPGLRLSVVALCYAER